MKKKVAKINKRGSYDSNFEKRLQESLDKDFKYHPCSLDYIKYASYTPDWALETEDKIFYIEAKGYFRKGREDTSKYIAVIETFKRKKEDCEKECKQYKEEELIFIFQNGKTPMPGAKRRKKCGTKQTVGEWATRNGIRWFCFKRGLPKDLKGAIVSGYTETP